MSFSGKVREELAGNISPARHCQIAELAAFIGLCGTIAFNRFDRCNIKIHSEPLQHKNSFGKLSCCKKSLYIDRKNI